MGRSLCLLVIICVFLCLGEAGPSRQGPHWPWSPPRPHGPWPHGGGSWPWPQPNLPSSIREICGKLYPNFNFL